MKIFLKTMRELTSPTKLLIILYTLIAIKINIIDFSLSPDEIKFLFMAENINWFQTPSPEYFGQLYWIFLKAISKLTPSFLYAEVAKIIFSSLLYCGLLSCIFYSNTNKIKFYCIALALTSPLFYWSGKMIGPEILSVSLVFFGLALHSVKKDKFSFLILGLAVGIKLTVLPVLIYILINKLFDHFRIRDLFLYGLLVCLGFVIANPTDNVFIITRLIETRSNTSQALWPYFKSLLTLINFRPSHIMTWDLIPNNSFQDVTFFWFTYVLILFGSLLTNRKLFISYSIFLIFHFIWIIKGNSGFGFPWYWMSLVPVSLHVFSNLKLDLPIFNNKYFSKINLGIIIILCSFFQSSPVIFSQIDQKQYHKKNIANFGEDYLCFVNNYQLDDLKVMKRVGFEMESSFKLPMYEYSMKPQGGDWENTLGEDFYLLISSRFFYGSTFSQNILKNRNILLGRCGDILIFRIFSKF